MNFLDKMDKNLLKMQFKIKMHEIGDSEFQSFFSSLMEKVDPGFRRVPSGGGDGGNDGWFRDGHYYQCYAPLEPTDSRDAKAAEKARNDFHNIQKTWDDVSGIQAYTFVYNDKYRGAQRPEKVMAELRKEFPNIEFELVLAQDLEKRFLDLDETDIQNLGFSIDSRKVVSIYQKYLDEIERELDRENAVSAKRMLDFSKDGICSLADNQLLLKYGLLECRYLRQIEDVVTAKKKYQELYHEFPEDSRAALFLAEVLFSEGCMKDAEIILKEVEDENADFWLLSLEKMIKSIYTGEKVSLINEIDFPLEHMASFYRIKAVLIGNSGDIKGANRLIAKAIRLNKDRFTNYIVRLDISLLKMHSAKTQLEQISIAKDVLVEISDIENIYPTQELNVRSRLMLSYRKLQALMSIEDFSGMVSVLENIFDVIFKCYCDRQIEGILSAVLMRVSLPKTKVIELVEYLKSCKRKISEDVAEAVVYQCMRSNILNIGEKFFRESGLEDFADFVCNIQNKRYSEVVIFLKERKNLAVLVINASDKDKVLRKHLIENVGFEDGDNIKNELLLLAHLDEENFDDAFTILKKINLEEASYVVCEGLLKVAHEKNAYDFEIKILEVMLKRPIDIGNKIALKLQLLNAFFAAQDYVSVIDLGCKILSEDAKIDLIDKYNKEALLAMVIESCLKRGNVDVDVISKANNILETYSHYGNSFEFKIAIESELHIARNKPELALHAVVEGVKVRKVLSGEEYARLWVIFLKITNCFDIDLKSLERSTENSFVKLKEDDVWLHLGEGEHLDATPIKSTSKKYKSIIDHAVGDCVVSGGEYGSESNGAVLEMIFPIEKYIFWKVLNNFQRLSYKNDLDGVQVIKVLNDDGTPDFTHLKKFMEDSQKKESEIFFDQYCQQVLPLAILSVSEGGLTKAIGRIQNEQRGFVHFSDGTHDEFERQKEVVREIMNDKKIFYIDGTSALVLAERGLLSHICSLLPAMRAPQSVISFLISFANQFAYSDGQMGTLGYVNGQISYSSIDKNVRDQIRNDILVGIKEIEKNVEVISEASKSNKFSEKLVPPEQCDACILAQNADTSILTEDFLYLKVNELDTGKKSPRYFSSLALLQVLYERNRFDFDNYIDYFSYLSSYRFRFLKISSADLEKAVLEKDGHINVKNIQKMNLPLVLSEEYGVSFKSAFNVIVHFTIRMLVNDKIAPNKLVNTIDEIVRLFPTDMEKRDFKYFLLKSCDIYFEKNKKKIDSFLSNFAQTRISSILEKM